MINCRRPSFSAKNRKVLSYETLASYRCGLGVGLIVLIIIVIVYVYSSLDSLIKTAVEKVGSKITQVEVQLDKVEVSIASARALFVG